MATKKHISLSFKKEAVKKLLKLMVPFPEALDEGNILCAWCGKSQEEIEQELSKIDDPAEMENYIKEFSISSLCVICQEEMFKEEEE